MEPECSSPWLQKPTTPALILSQIKPAHAPQCNFLKIHLNINLTSTSGSSKWPLNLGLPTKTLYAPLLCLIYATWHAHLILLDLINQTIFGEGYISLSSSLCSFLHSPVTLYLLGSNILLSSLFSNALRLCSFLTMSDQVSHPHKTTHKIIVPYLNLCIFG